MNNGIRGKIESQGTCHGVAFSCHLRSQRIGIWQQFVAQPDMVDYTLIERFARIAESPYLSGSISTMTSKHRQEGGKLEHSRVQFTIGRVVAPLRELTLIEPSVPFVRTYEECTYINRPIRTSRSHEIQACRNHLGKALP